MSVPQRKYTVAICTLGTIRFEHEGWLLQQTGPFGFQRHLAYVCMPDSDLQTVRCKAYEMAKEYGSEFLVLYDDDIIPLTTGAIAGLIGGLDQNDDIDIIGGVYPIRRDPPDPIVIKNRGEGAWWGWQDGKLHRVYMTGTGLTAYRMSSLANIPTPTFEFSDEETDDSILAQKVKALGMKWYVDGSVTADQLELNGKRWQFKDAKRERAD